MPNTQFKFNVQVQMGYRIFEHDNELSLPDNIVRQPQSDLYFQYANKLKEELMGLKIFRREKAHLNPLIEIKLFLFHPIMNDDEVIHHHVEIIVSQESKLLVFDNIEEVDKEVKQTIEHIKDYIYDMAVLRMNVG